MALRILPSDLLPNERVLTSKAVNLVVSLKECGISQFPFEGLSQLIGYQGMDGLGGRAYLTNYRILFKTHMFNRIRGSQSIFLPNIRDISAVPNGISVDTITQLFYFEMWFTKDYVQTVKETMSSLTTERTEELKQLVKASLPVVDVGLKNQMDNVVIDRICAGEISLQSELSKLKGLSTGTFLQIVELLA